MSILTMKRSAGQKQNKTLLRKNSIKTCLSRGKGTLLIRIIGQTMAFEGDTKSKSLKIVLIFSDLPINKDTRNLFIC